MAAHTGAPAFPPLESAVGMDSVGAPGESMRGVTGREPIFAAAAPGEYDPNEGLFDIPVDSEHKAKKLKIFSIKQPHMRSFHLAWISFFTAFCAAFAAPPLVPVIRDNVNMTHTDTGNAAITSVIGSIISRLAIGSVCDLVGPRYGCAFLLMTCVPCTVSMAAISSGLGFIIVRLFIGFVLATFVTCQYWMSSMFNAKIVGLANGLAAGWGNMGGGAIQLIMPGLYALIRDSLHSPHFTAWRIAFFIPAFAQIFMGLLVLTFGQDHPDGQYLQLNKSGERKMDSFLPVLINAVTNYRAWICAALYGFSFGVELTLDNNAANYFTDRFNLDLATAGVVASSFGLMNIVARPSGGLFSDLSARRFGMRGRLWTTLIMHLCGGAACIVLGKMDRLAPSIVMLVIFSFFIQSTCGTIFGIVPFVSRRSLGIVAGLTGAGGNAGSAIVQSIFFTDSSYSTQDGFVYMGIMIMGVACFTLLIYFPQWGGAIFPASKAPTATEEAYYTNEYSKREQADNKHASAMKFAANAKGERGRAAPPANEDYVDDTKKAPDV